MSARQPVPVWDHTSHEKFYDYYARASQTQETLERFTSILDVTLRTYQTFNPHKEVPVDVADIGCGAGVQSIIWSKHGHRVHGLDINEPLVRLARERANRQGHKIQFTIGTATALPWPDSSMDICLVPELLEHISDWQSCVNEFARVLRPGGVLFLSTTNWLCPKQQEFKLPCYSWYPRHLKQYFERLALTTHPEIVNYARYPAVNWFSFYGLRRTLEQLGFLCLDRFDVVDLSRRGSAVRFLVRAIQAVSLLRLFAHMVTPSLIILAVKTHRDANQNQ